MSTARIAFTIIGMLLIIVAAYFTTYYIASRNSRRIVRGRTIRLHDNFSMSKDKSICVIEVAERVYLLAMSSSAIKVLAELDSEEFERIREKNLKEMRSPLNPDTIQGGFTAVRNNYLFKRLADSMKKKDVTRAIEEQPAAESVEPDHIEEDEDGLDAVFRKIQVRRAQRDTDTSQGRATDS